VLAGGGTVRLFGINLLVVLVAFALTFSVLVYAREYERLISVDRPLEELLRSEQWIRESELRPDRGEIVVWPKWTEAISTELESLLGRVAELGASRYRTVTMVDTRTPRLQELYYHIHLVVYQALASRDFASMERALDAFAETNGLDCLKVWLFGESALVEIKDDSSFMYQAIGQVKIGDIQICVRFKGP